MYRIYPKSHICEQSGGSSSLCYSRSAGTSVVYPPPQSCSRSIHHTLLHLVSPTLPHAPSEHQLACSLSKWFCLFQKVLYMDSYSMMPFESGCFPHTPLRCISVSVCINTSSLFTVPLVFRMYPIRLGDNCLYSVW